MSEEKHIADALKFLRERIVGYSVSNNGFRVIDEEIAKYDPTYTPPDSSRSRRKLVADRNNRIEALVREKDEMKSAWRKESVQWAQKQSALEAENTTLRDRLTTLRKENAELKAEKRMENPEPAATVSDFWIEIGNSCARIADRNSRVQLLESALAALKDRKDRITQLENEVGESYHRGLNDRQDEIDFLEAKFTAAMKLIEKAEEYGSLDSVSQWNDEKAESGLFPGKG